MKNLFTILICLLLFASCKKKDDIEYLSPNIKTKFAYKPGSYWIYRDSISGRVDSCWLNYSKIIYTSDYEEPRNTEILIIAFNQRAIAPIDTKTCEWSLVFEGLNLIGYYSDSILDIHPQMIDCNYPISSGYNGQTFNSKNSQITALGSYSLGANIFQNVAKIAYSNNVTYFNDSVGYIKKELNILHIQNNYTTNTSDTIKINEVWELQRWYVIK